MKKLDQVINRESAWLFLIFFAFALWAFWPNYFSKILTQNEIRFHTHGLAMTFWCLMLIGQATLIRTKNHALHKKIGAFSYVLVPIIVVTTINLIHHQLSPRFIIPTKGSLFSMALMLNATIAFVVLYGLAMRNKSKPKIHAKYMVATIFPMFTPITDRLIYIFFRPLVQYHPMINGKPFVQLSGFLLADILLGFLVWWEFRQTRKFGPFAISMAIVVVYQISVGTLHNFGFWRTFSVWFMGLPLS